MTLRRASRQFLPASLVLVLAAAAVLYAVFVLRTGFRIAGITYFTLVDDAMVSMRYAQHLARGFGLVWNVGQPPVEGFTNPLWMLVMTGLHLLPLPLSKISLAVMLLSALILLATACVVFAISSALRPALRLTPFLAAALVAFYFPLVFWALRGMEVGLIVLLVSASLLVVLREPSPRHALLLGVLLALAVITRLDVLLQAFVIIGYSALTRRSRRDFLLPLALVLLTAAAVLVFQRLYFGDFLPNTYYQKLAGTDLVERLRNGFLAFYRHALWDTALPGAISLLCLVLFKDFRRPAHFLLAALFAVQCAYSVWVGGDYAEPELDAANRFITQGMPALIILFSFALDRLLASARLRPEAMRGALALSLAVLGLLVMSGRPWLRWLSGDTPLLAADMRRTRQGLLLAKYTSPQALIAVHAAGQIPYYSGRTVVDLLGLNDPVIAKGPVTGPFYPGHDKWNYAYSIGQLRPDVIADNWVRLGDFMKGQPGYEHLDNGLYIRTGTTLVNIRALSREYR